jgi:hypothetical protein
MRYVADDKIHAMSYWRRACRWAWARTQTYTIKKAVPSAAIAAIQGLLASGSIQKRALTSIALIIAVYILLYAMEFVWKAFILAPISLDAEREEKDTALLTEIQALKVKPKPTAAERHHLDAARSSLEKLGPPARDILRYLDNHKALTFGSYNPMMPAPQGMRWGDVREMLNLLAGEDLVTVSQKRLPGDMEYTYTIAPGKITALRDLLYESTPESPHRDR